MSSPINADAAASAALEAAARTALESLAARVLTDEEWERVRSRLLGFVTILRDWNRQAEVPKTYRTDNVVEMRAKTCEPLDKAA